MEVAEGEESANPYDNLQGTMAGTLRGNAENMFKLNTGDEGKYSNFDDLESDSDGRDDLENSDPKDDSLAEEVKKQQEDRKDEPSV